MATSRNRLIALLAPADRARLFSMGQSVDLVLNEVLTERNERTRHVYFPVTCFISLIAQLDDHPGIEVGMVGREGMLGVQLALGVDRTPLRALVQGPGTALRVEAAAFRLALAASPSMQAGLNRYLYVLMSQLATSASCLRFHLIGPRLARWLLMSHDRAGADRFHVTHEFLAYMLGVRRSGITTAAKLLQRSGLIMYRRGELTVLDRTGLEASACSCYAADQASYAMALGQINRLSPRSRPPPGSRQGDACV